MFGLEVGRKVTKQELLNYGFTPLGVSHYQYNNDAYEYPNHKWTLYAEYRINASCEIALELKDYVIQKAYIK